MVRKLKIKNYYFDKYFILTFYIEGIFFDNIYIFAKIIREIYVTDGFKINISINVNIFTSKRTIIDFIIQFIKINNYRNIFNLIKFYTHFSFIKRIIKKLLRIILLSRVTTLIIVIFFNKLL